MDRFTKQYIFALSIIAVLALLSDLSLTSVIRSQESSAEAINISGRQRMLTQRMALLVLQMTTTSAKSNRLETIREELIAIIQLTEQSHHDLSNPTSYLYRNSKMSAAIHNIYYTEPHNFNKLVGEYLDAGKHILAYEDSSQGITEDKPLRYPRSVIHLIMQYSKNDLISELDQIVKQYETESSDRVIFLRQLENLVLVITWISLLLIALFIFRPMVKAIKSSRGELLRDIDERKQVERHLLTVVEQERGRISRELHDSASQQVAGMAMMVQSLSNKFKQKHEPETESLIDVAKNLRALGNDLRQIIHDLAPMEIENDSLREALAKLVETVNAQGETEYKLTGTEPVQLLDHETEIQLLRIVQEAVHNTQKHAHAKSVRVELEQKNGFLRLSITDDGVGFTVPAGKTDGFGLGIMNYRASVIGASLDIKSSTGQGTKIVCSLPVNNS